MNERSVNDEVGRMTDEWEDFLETLPIVGAVNVVDEAVRRAVAEAYYPALLNEEIAVGRITAAVLRVVKPYVTAMEQAFPAEAEALEARFKSQL